MIKKFLGVLFAMATLALIVLAALQADSYESILPEDLFTLSESTQPAVKIAEPATEPAIEPATEQADLVPEADGVDSLSSGVE